MAGLVLLAVTFLAVWFVELEYAYEPPPENVAAAPRLAAPAFDLWGRGFSRQEADRLLATAEGRELLSPSNGAVPIDEAVLAKGRRAFYTETYRNELFLTDVVGFLDGPLDLWAFAKALALLAGRGTTNLQVALSKDADIAGRAFHAGDVVDTDLDVPRGAFLPLGLKLFSSHGRIRVGVTCALCHAAVDRASGKVVEGAPNADFQAGLLLAMGTNSAAYVANTDAKPAKGPNEEPPSAAQLETAVDAVLRRWPPGFFDSTIDQTADPSQIPDSFTFGGHPYGWTGFASSGPFHGLTALGNNVHGQNSDATSQLHLTRLLFDLDPEAYLALVLRNAPDRGLRHDPASGLPPSRLVARFAPAPGMPALNDIIRSPDYPRVSSVVPDGVMISKPGRRVWELNNAISAFQNTLAPPPPPGPTPHAAAGRTVFERAGCADCHAGPRHTNNRLVPAPDIGTEPTRALAMQKTEPLYEPNPNIPAFDTPVPPPPGAKTVAVPPGLEPDQARLAMAYGNAGGYKVKGLTGLRLTAPYLHDGGVAVGPDPAVHLGVPGTLGQGVAPDPANSLRALVDRELRAKAVRANQADADLVRVHVQGVGHEFWVDEAAGFTRDEQDALIQYLLWLPGT